MRILRNYIIIELIKPFILSIVVFTFVLLVGNIIQLADMIINKGVQIFYVFKLFMYLVPYLLSFTMPMALLTATLLIFGRLSSDNEINAMRSSGIGLYQIVFPVIMVGLIFSLFSIPLNDDVLPNAHFASRKTLKDIGIKNPTAYLEEGTFIRGFEDYVIFIYQINKNKLKNIRIYQPQEGKPTRTIIAERGEILVHPEKEYVELKLFNGTSEEPSPTDPGIFYKLNFKVYTMSLDLTEILKKGEIQKKTKEMTIKELEEEISKMENEQIDVRPLITEIHKKLSLSFSSLAFVLIGIPLGVRAHRSEKSIGFGISLALFTAYWGFFLGGTALALNGKLPPWLGVWSPNIVLGFLGIVLLHLTARR